MKTTALNSDGDSTELSPEGTKSKLPSYAVVIPTYGRPDVVRLAIECCIEQSVLPRQIVVVDASPDFTDQRGAITSDLEIPDKLALIYVQAKKASCSNQRNEGIDLCEDVDVVFFIDDDTFLYQNCAEEALKVYAADTEQKIAAIQLASQPNPPQMVAFRSDDLASKRALNDSTFAERLKIKFQVIWKHIFLMGPEFLFIPYDGNFHSVKDVCAENGTVYPAMKLMEGCRMTYRFGVIDKERFDADLVRYCAAEDLDASYRASRHGRIVECNDARMYHKAVATSRVNRFRAVHMASLNIAVFLYKHSNNMARDRTRYVVLTVRRLAAEFLKDSLSLRLTYPQFRGVFKGSVQGISLIFSSPDNNEKILALQAQFTD